MQQILEGCAYIHQKKFIHRDMKSSLFDYLAANLLMNNKGEIKITDFGLARYHDPNVNTKLTRKVVTVWYRAPELFFGDRNYNSKIDIWSIG